MQTKASPSEVIPHEERAYILHDAVADLGIDAALSCIEQHESGAVSAIWEKSDAANNMRCYIECHFDRDACSGHTAADFLDESLYKQSQELVNCAITLSLSSRITGLPRISLKKEGDLLLVLASRSTQDPIPPKSLIQIAFLVLHETMKLQNASDQQDWGSDEAVELLAAMVRYREHRGRLPEKALFPRFLRSLDESIQEFAAKSDDTYAIARERAREL